MLGWFIIIGVIIFRDTCLVLSVTVHITPVVLAENKEGVTEPPCFLVRVISEVSTDKTAIAKRYYTEGCLEVRNADAFAIGVGLKAE